MVSEYLIILHDNGVDEVVRRETFKDAVKVYRMLIEVYGPKVQIFQKVVDYGETI